MEEVIALIIGVNLSYPSGPELLVFGAFPVLQCVDMNGSEAFRKGIIPGDERAYQVIE